MLAAHLQAPVVTQTTVAAHALQVLKVVTQSSGQSVRVHLGSLAVLEVLATVQHPVGDLHLLGVGQACHQLLNLISRQLASAVRDEGWGGVDGCQLSGRQAGAGLEQTMVPQRAAAFSTTLQYKSARYMCTHTACSCPHQPSCTGC